MKILYYCNEYPPEKSGGIGIFTKEIAERLAADKNNEVYVYGMYSLNEKKIEIINNVFIIRDVKNNGLLNFITNRVRAYISIKNLINDREIDLIEVQEFNGLIAFWPKVKAKIVVRLHGSVIYFRTLLHEINIKNLVWRIVEKKTIMSADKIISVSEFTARKTKEIFKFSKDIDVIHNGINFDGIFREKKSSDHKHYIFSGSIIKKKGVIELIEAWLIFSEDKKNVSLSLYGKDIENLTDILIKKLKSHHNSTVYFHGPVQKDELMLAYSKCDFCLFPSKAEAFSLSPLEAMGMSRVVLYTDQTSARELIDDKNNGILIKDHCVDSILQSLNYSYYLEEDEYARIARNAFMTVKNKFSIEKVIYRNIETYQDILKYRDSK
ncbi:glycosyltransferase family 4 protein [Pectobacterium carotovorum subsp. carotovorum]|uniref:glycosyltransferase family 4 protein n=1 Tax=Pectobacterium carotovorum TaxID=554 RepID=UPI002365925C|nr:glycosyltransferase family 4 protein [Pectobacterium carotovorum]WDG00263.1 glycosyltransferase family 4 protein [Pectobacterium carotovorum subsp. carotovorum]